MPRKPFHSLRAKMLLWAFLFVIPILWLLYRNIWQAANSFESQTWERMSTVLSPFAADIDSALSSTKRYIANLNVDLSMIDPATPSTPDQLRQLNALVEKISEGLALYPLMDAIFLYRCGHLRFIQNYNRSYAENRTVALAMNDHLDAHPSATSLFAQGYQWLQTDQGFYLYLAMNVDQGVAGGWFRIDALLSNIRQSNLHGLTHVMLSDRQNHLLDDAFRETSHVSWTNTITTCTPLLTVPFDVVTLWDESIVFAPVHQMYRGIEFAAGAAGLLFILYILFLHFSLVRPLNRLVHVIDGIRDSKLSAIPVRKNEDAEIKNVYHALNAMTGQIESLKIQMYEEKLCKQKAQMQVLQFQIRPHFLINALNRILSFARISNYDLVQQMTMYLATHCRYILYHSWFVTLAEELAYTQNFVDMQSTQRDRPYRYEVQADDDGLDFEIPILSIQIFVENALKHSHRPDHEVEISVHVARIANAAKPALQIRIEDNGQGFHSDELIRFNASEILPCTEKDHGIGIANVRQRLKILYHDDAQIHFSNRRDGGARVEIVLPIDRKEENEP